MRRPRRRRRPRRLAVATTAVVFAVSTFSMMALTAANVVPASKADLETRSRTVPELAPSACAGLPLVNVVVGGNGGNGNDLVLGTGAGETLMGSGGTDCVVGGGGNDNLWGNGGSNDVCIGGPGTDTFGFFGFLSGCETQIQ